MIRAFAPGMTMQDPLAQTSSNFDVRHEPTAGPPSSVSVEPGEPTPSDLPAPEAESEFARLEQLLSARTRERRDLALELERRGALLRDACTRLSELAPRLTDSQLQKERDAAVARAVDAEVARTEATFKLDEVLGRLLALGGDRPAESQPTAAAREPTLASRLLELDELKQMADARVLLLEHELAHERERMANAVRERVESAEHFEFELSQARAEGSAARYKLRDAERASEAARPELERLRAELERAQVAARDAENESAVLRSQVEGERGALLTEVETERALRLDSDSELEALRGAVERERAALYAEVEARRAQLVVLQAELEGDRQALRAELESERTQLNDGSERERAALSVASSELQRVRNELQHARDALVGELDGLRFRVVEAEQALRSHVERLGRSQQRVRELENKLDAARSDRASESARVEALLVQLQEATQARASDQEQLRELRLEREQSAAAPMIDDLRAELTRERGARAALVAQLAAATPADSAQRYAAQQTRLEALRACLLELRLPLVEFETGLAQIAQGQGLTQVEAEVDHDQLAALEEQLRARDLRIQELEIALHERVEKPDRAVARDISTLKGELIDVRANATRLSDDLSKERARRRKMAVTVRALQAATESGEAPGPWIEELVAVINEGGSSLPPKP